MARDEQTDVVIVGSGLTGLSAGVEAREANAAVIVFEKMKVTGSFARDVEFRKLQNPRLDASVGSTNHRGATAEGLIAALRNPNRSRSRTVRIRSENRLTKALGPCRIRPIMPYGSGPMSTIPPAESASTPRPR